MADAPHIAYLFSRYPVVSQTFCDSEMLALEKAGVPLTVGSINAPPNSFRHGRLVNLRAEAFYPPPSGVLEALKAEAVADGSWAPLADLVARHDRAYGESFKAETRARNALYFARLFRRKGVDHVHVHFANRATHTALFMKALGLPFSFTAHAQDFMVDLGSDALLAEMCREAAFVVAVSDYSRELLRARCPDSAEKIHRVYNGIEPTDFPAARRRVEGEPLRVIAIGRLIEFKGFHHLVEACGILAKRGVAFECVIIGAGPWCEALEKMAVTEGVAGSIRFAGVLGQEAVKAELARSDVFCLPSIVDSKGASDILPTVIMEAMACGLPVVSTTLAGIPEMVEHGKTGLLVEPGEVGAVGPLADALAEFAADTERAARFGGNGHRRVTEVFSLAATSGELKRHFDAAITASPTRPATARVLYLIGKCPTEPVQQLDEELALALADPAFAVFAARADGETAGTLPVDYLPDGIVLEADWRADPETVAGLEEWRNTLGTAIEGEDFFREARRALHLAGVMRKRNLRQVHAARSDTVLCAWLVAKINGATASTAIEDKPATSRSLLAKLLRDFQQVSLSDPKLAEKLKAPDALGLRVPDSHRHAGIGPFRLKLRLEESEADRTARRNRAKSWLERIASFPNPNPE
jgi:glycosyltransferase involved in cell wall biosynthesis